MDSADFCEADLESFPSWRCPVGFRVLWLPNRFQLDLIQAPVTSQTALSQISPDKSVNCPAATVSFTVPLEPEVSLCCANSPRGLSLL